MSPIQSRTAPQRQHAISLASKDAIAGGGLWDDVDVEITDAKFVKFNFKKKNSNEDNYKLTLGVEFTPLAGLEEGQEPYQQMFSAGRLDFFIPSEDGLSVIPVADKTGLNVQCGAVAFLNSMEECNKDVTALLESGDISAIVGTKMHVKRFKLDKRTDGTEATGDQIKCTSILSLPGAASTGKTAAKAPAGRPAAAAKPNGAAAATQAAANGNAANGDTDVDMAALVVAILDAAGGSVAYSDLNKLAFKRPELKSLTHGDRIKFCGQIADEAFLAGLEDLDVVYDAAEGIVAKL